MTDKPVTSQKPYGLCWSGIPATFIPSRPVMKVSGRNTVATMVRLRLERVMVSERCAST